MKLLVCIPAYNEEKIIVPTVEAVARELFAISDISWHIVVADNGSTDRTAQVLRERNFPYATVLSVAKKGKGNAIREAASFADADVFGFIDADLSAHPASINRLLAEIARGADLAIGSRLLDKKSVHRGAFRTLSSVAFNMARKALLGINVADSQCGLKLMNAQGIVQLRRCNEGTWFLDAELLARAQKNKLRIVEVPIAWEEEFYPGRKSKLSVLRDGFGAISAFWRIRRNVRIS
jgi:glycosyltransferase involved in cell wall biosynthesis